MLHYINQGERNYFNNPIRIYCRGVFELQLIAGGSVLCISENGETEVSAGTLVVSDLSERHGWSGRKGTKSEIYVLQFQKLPEPLESYLSIKKQIFLNLNLSEIEQFIASHKRLKNYLVKGEGSNYLDPLRESLRLSLVVLDKIQDFVAIEKPNHSRQLVENAIAMFREQMSTGSGVAEISDFLGYSTAHVRRLFNETTQKSPVAVFNEIRMSEARDLLLKTELEVSEIALGVGYKSLSVFSRAFKNHFGCSPQQFRGV